MEPVERLDTRCPARRQAAAFKTQACLLLFVALGCETGSQRPAPKADATAAAKAAVVTGPEVTGAKHYGAALAGAPQAPLATVLATPSDYAGRAVSVEGHVRRACTAMGCWMELADGTAADAPACRVIMKDHAFFVPTDSAGSSAKVEGTLDVRRIEPAQVAHMEGEGATFPNKAPDGSAQEIRFVASGVELWRGS